MSRLCYNPTVYITVRPCFVRHNLQQYCRRFHSSSCIRDPGLWVDQSATFSHSLQYTPYLSAFIKIAQLFVIQRAVPAVDRGEVPHIADMLNVMQERFMVYGMHSPVNWTQKLRSFGKQINEINTSLGYIS